MRKTHLMISAVLALSFAGACADSPVAPTRVASKSGASLAASSSGYVDITAGSNFSCGLLGNGSIVCWGDNTDGQLNVPAGTYKSVDASAFQNNVCAIRTDDTLACWGSPAEGMTTPPAGTFKDVSMGLVHSCAVRTDGTMACWGRDWWMPVTDLMWIDNSNFAKVAAGFEYSCGLKNDGSILCWGGGGVGQTNPPSPEGPYTAISAGYTGSCALRTTGELVCWGNRFGTEGVAPAGSNWTGVGGGAVGYCAVNSAGGISCGHTDYPDLFTNNAPAGTYVQVDMGGSHACGILSDGSANCWSGSPTPLPFSLTPPVIVVSPATAAGNLALQVNALVSSGAISASAAATLGEMAKTAAGMYAEGKTIPAYNKIGEYINHVNALLKSKKISQATATALISAAEEVQALSGTGKKK